MCGDGCECLSSNISASCSVPSSLGSLSLGQTITTSANVVPLGDENWYAVTFTGNTSSAYHPYVRFTSNPNNEFVFDLRTNCSGTAIGCGTEGGVSNGVTAWETSFTNPAPVKGGYYAPIPAVGNGGMVLLRVYRRAGIGLTCNSYTLAVSN